MKKSTTAPPDGFSRAPSCFFVVAVAVIATVSLVARATGSKIQAPLEGMSLTARSCTFKECFASNCNHDEAPYTCLFHNGGPHGGW